MPDRVAAREHLFVLEKCVFVGEQCALHFVGAVLFSLLDRRVYFYRVVVCSSLQSVWYLAISVYFIYLFIYFGGAWYILGEQCVYL